MNTAIRTQLKREGGQALVMFVLALSVIMGFVAMSVDVGLILHERRSMQNAADAAALAGVQDLPFSPSTAVVAANKWAKENGYSQADGANVSVVTPYQADDAAVEVSIEQETPFFFARVLGLNTISVHARAVAAREPGYGYAIFAFQGSCSSPSDIDMSGANFDIQGDVHTNGDLKLSSSDILASGSVTYGCSDPLITGSSVDASAGFEESEQLDWPFTFQSSDFTPCTFNSGGNITISKSDPQYWVNDDPSTNTLKPGVYCSAGDITIQSSATGTVTFVAKKTISFTGGTYDLDAHTLGVLAYTSYDPPNQTLAAIKVNATSFTWTGFLLAPNGQIQFSAQESNTDSGSIMGETVKVSLSGGSLTTPINPDEWGAPRLAE